VTRSAARSGGPRGGDAERNAEKRRECAESSGFPRFFAD